IPLAIGCSFEPDLARRTAAAMAKESAAAGTSFIAGPMVDVARDPRWGRNEESYSEDPYLTAVMAEQYVRGLQGIDDGVVNTIAGSKEEGTKYLKMAPTLKHYAANNSEGNRAGGTANVSNPLLRDYYTWTFQRVVEDTGVASVMASYNAINTVPQCGNRYTLTTLLRQTFGFTGFVVNDCGGMLNMVNPVYQNWKPQGWTKTVTYPQAVAFGVKAGDNMDCGGGGAIDWVYDKFTVASVDQGLISEDDVDKNLMEIFRMRFESGEFDAPGGTMAVYKESKYTWATSTEAQPHLDLALQSGLEAGVLLKNANNALPINSATVPSVKVYGPLMNYCDIGDYSGNPTKLVPFKDGMANIAASKGITSKMSFANGMSNTGALTQTDIDTASHNGVSVVFIGTAHGSGGVNSTYASFGVCNEGKDRVNIQLPNNQVALVNAIAAKTKAAGGKTVVVMQAVGPMDVSGFIDNVDALLFTAYNGQLQGTADAMLLFGDANPCGHLTQTWYKNDSQLYNNTGTGATNAFLNDYTIDNENDKMGRTYMYYDGYDATATADQKPAYPFGYGLSYTTFKVDNAKVADQVDASGIVHVTADVANTGAVKGAEVVQVYVKAPGAGNGIVAMQQLMGFARVELAPGEKQSVSIDVRLKDLTTVSATDTQDLSTVKDGVLQPGDNDISAATHGKRELVAGNYTFTVATDSVTPVGSGTVALVSSQFKQQLKVVTLTLDKISAKIGEQFGSQVSVCMTDESFLQPGAAGLTITYASDTPSVATVNAATGQVTAIAGGTALIKATFTYQGQTMTAQYPVAVIDVPYLDAVKVNGAAVSGFAYNKFSYSVEVPLNATSIPDVTYTVPDIFTVTKTMPTKLP
ncbi:MAG: glycoside hydrolase family 3 C-terminal domain-containing protein, partial [Oscillospiraceae bacterium]|nr:glycoside hydrolase family 3 C-terminal domain-containing protein [Oscillospiraceae bacterium]